MTRWLLRLHFYFFGPAWASEDVQKNFRTVLFNKFFFCKLIGSKRDQQAYFDNIDMSAPHAVAVFCPARFPRKFFFSNFKVYLHNFYNLYNSFTHTLFTNQKHGRLFPNMTSSDLRAFSLRDLNFILAAVSRVFGSPAHGYAELNHRALR